MKFRSHVGLHFSYPDLIQELVLLIIPKSILLHIIRPSLNNSWYRLDSRAACTVGANNDEFCRAEIVAFVPHSLEYIYWLIGAYCNPNLLVCVQSACLSEFCLYYRQRAQSTPKEVTCCSNLWLTNTLGSCCLCYLPAVVDISITSLLFTFYSI